MISNIEVNAQLSLPDDLETFLQKKIPFSFEWRKFSNNFKVKEKFGKKTKNLLIKKL